MDVFADIFSPTLQQPLHEQAHYCAALHDAVFHTLPSSLQNVNAVSLKNNLAVLPGEWESGSLTSSLFDITPTNACFGEILHTLKSSSFIAYDSTFLSLLGPQAQVEIIQSFPPDKQNIHEAPVFLPETNELLYSDTSLIGTLFAVGIDPPHSVRALHSSPPLPNVNGGTTRPADGHVFLATNGGPVRGLYALDLETGAADVVLNHFRGRRFNSPNDLVFDSRGDLYFTDPPYGRDSGWPGVQAPELPRAIYRFAPRTGAVTTLSTGVVATPNGLAFSPDERTLYVADSNSTGGGLTSQRGVFAFPVRVDGLLDPPRLVHQVESGWPDGLRVTRTGLLMVAVAGGVDVVDPERGVLLGKVNTPGDVIFNLEPARGREGGVWLLTGMKHIYKVTIQEGAVERSAVLGAGAWARNLWSIIGLGR